MNKKFDGDPATYTHFGFFGLIPCWVRPPSGEEAAHVRPVWDWLEAPTMCQLYILDMIGKALHRVWPKVDMGFTIYTVLRL